jgi:hypothetical protein
MPRLVRRVGSASQSSRLRDAEVAMIRVKTGFGPQGPHELLLRVPLLHLPVPPWLQYHRDSQTA